jgi:hypothetical protein
MRKKTDILLILSFILILTFSILPVVSHSVPVIPNESVIEGVVVEYAIVSSRLTGVKPEQTLYRLTISMTSSHPVDNEANLLVDKVGKDVLFYSREELPPELFGKKIRAKARYKGDERGGRYWIRDVESVVE